MSWPKMLSWVHFGAKFGPDQRKGKGATTL